MNLEVPKMNSQIVMGDYAPKKNFLIITNEDLDEVNFFQSHGRCVFYEAWLKDPLESILFDYFICDTRKAGALDYLKCSKLENYNVIYYTSNKNNHRKLTDKFKNYDNINVLSSIPNNDYKENFDKLLMFGARIQDLVLDENIQKTAKSLFSCFSRK
jgi:hypothetical protein